MNEDNPYVKLEKLATSQAQALHEFHTEWGPQGHDYRPLMENCRRCQGALAVIKQEPGFFVQDQQAVVDGEVVTLSNNMAFLVKRSAESEPQAQALVDAMHPTQPAEGS